MNLIEYKGKTYPAFQSEGFAAQFAIPYALKFCKGIGVDIGCKNKEWALPDAIPIDLEFQDGYHALNLPKAKELDYIFSSHCVEHFIFNWTDALDYWIESLKKGGVIFLYLPDYSQEYWKPWNNKKHIHILTPKILTDYFIDRGMKNIFSSGVDLNNAFMVVAEK